ncbi:cell division protein FtsL [Ruminococcus sp.]|uniref:cell division protein FtsL n=1 Tax=Ruminococcus sp. TaxID=41978 RepID=UPI0025FADD4D|nr:cell division protein FtsL [Ruminococcus sp.]
MAKVHNLAYDYSIYDNAEEQAVREIKYKKNPAAKQKKTSVVKIMAVCMLALAIFGAMIFGKVEISSLCSEQTKQLEQLEQLQGENVSLQSELAQKTNMSKVEEYAENELGLKKLDKSQIEYVTVDSDSVAKVVKTEESNVFVKIKRWFSSVLEYIGA